MLQRRYANLPGREIGRLFGGQFSIALLAQEEEQDDVWQGPFQSALGVHLVRITQRTEARMPSLVEIKSTVLQGWRERQQRRRTADEIAAIVDKYKIVIEGTEGQ